MPVQNNREFHHGPSCCYHAVRVCVCVCAFAAQTSSGRTKLKLLHEIPANDITHSTNEWQLTTVLSERAPVSPVTSLTVLRPFLPQTLDILAVAAIMIWVCTQKSR